MDLMNGAIRAAVEGVDNYEAITLNLDEIKVTKHNRYKDGRFGRIGNINSYGRITRTFNHWPGKRGSIFFPADIDGVKPLLFCRMRDTRRLRRTSRAALRT